MPRRMNRTLLCIGLGLCGLAGGLSLWGLAGVRAWGSDSLDAILILSHDGIEVWDFGPLRRDFGPLRGAPEFASFVPELFRPHTNMPIRRHWRWRPSRGVRGTSIDGVFIPFWIPFSVGAILMAVSLLRSRHRFPSGHCRSCGYNLTGNTSGRCPECGVTVPALAPAAATRAQSQPTTLNRVDRPPSFDL